MSLSLVGDSSSLNMTTSPYSAHTGAVELVFNYNYNCENAFMSEEEIFFPDSSLMKL
jgi:hypothetical protein